MSTDLFKDTAATITRLAVDAFAEHVVKKEGEDEWRCGKPGSVFHFYRILLRPGAVIVWGDLGEWVLRHADRDSLGWLRGAVHSSDYVVGKVKAGDAERFYPGEALRWLDENVTQHEDLARESYREMKEDDGEELTCEPVDVDVSDDEHVKEARAFREKIRREIDGWTDADAGFFDGTLWHMAFRNAGGDDPPRCMYPCEGALWLVEALRWFVAHVDEKAKEVAA